MASSKQVSISLRLTNFLRQSLRLSTLESFACIAEDSEIAESVHIVESSSECGDDLRETNLVHFGQEFA